MFVDRELWARFIRGHPADDLLVDLFSALRFVCDPCIGHALPGPFDNLIGLADATLIHRRVSNDANRVSCAANDILDAARVESDDHTRQIVRAKPCKRVVNQDLGRFLGIRNIADEFHGFLITADIPELCLSVNCPWPVKNRKKGERETHSITSQNDEFVSIGLNDGLGCIWMPRDKILEVRIS